jgi:hypothetical protein
MLHGGGAAGSRPQAPWLGNADLGMKIRPDYMDVRWIVILGVQGDLVGSKVFDR